MDGAQTRTASVAEGLLRALKRRGIDYVLANAGTDFAPVIEGLVRLQNHRDAIPRFITVPHENLAMAMAHGYYQVAGKPAGVMVHVTVGTGNTICALMNAARDNVPLLLDGGTHAADAERPHRVAFGADSLGPGELRPGRRRARIHEVGLRAARGPARRRGGRPRTRRRARRATRARLSDAAARSAGRRRPRAEPTAADDGASAAAAERQAHRSARRLGSRAPSGR